MEASVPDDVQRRQLAAFLRSRRDRLTPLDIGMSAGARRRTPGLRREEVAQLADISVTWYTWLEQGRDITVSRQVLDSIARALRLTPTERRHLFSLACEPLPAGMPAEPPSPALQRLVDGISPFPAYLINPRWDLLAWNQAEAGLIGDPALLAAPERNILWLAFADPAMRRLLVDWRGQARSMITQFRADIAQHADDPAVASLTAALRQASAEFREWWDRDAVAEFWPVRRQFDHPGAGLLTLDYVKLAAVETPGVKLITLVPADAMTSAKLPVLAGAMVPAAAGPAR
jgi:transcriptional regulator with XRE-family HTH domain